MSLEAVVPARLRALDNLPTRRVGGGVGGLEDRDEPSRLCGSAGVTLKAQLLIGQEQKSLFVVTDVVRLSLGDFLRRPAIRGLLELQTRVIQHLNPGPLL